MIQPQSQYALTVDALARSNGPYDVDAGATVQFTGGPNKSDTTYSWDFGDGSTAQGRVATHAYGDDGMYVAVLQTVVSEPGGVTTRHFAVVRARNVPPVVAPSPAVTCNEGDEVLYEVSFTDQEWLETHEAWFDWGDNSLPTQAMVSETNDPPRAQGTASAYHAYCDSGSYTITISVRDRHGGVGTGTSDVTVSNVPPRVDAGQDVYAYPDLPINLVAHFIDPGWCDEHTASWHFGDGTPRLPATVVELHQPPEGVGYAAATHVYEDRGDYFARCVVTDDDGASGEDWLVVRVVDVVNRRFEDGFRQRTVGQVANGWEPYILEAKQAGVLESAEVVALPSAATGASGTHAAEELIVRSGERSQRLLALQRTRTGILQSVGANPGWDYQITAFYTLDERGGGRCRLGVDPDGGTDPEASSIVWSAGAQRREWDVLTVRVTANGRRITIFLEVGPPPLPAPAGEEPPLEPEEQRTPAVAWFDDVKLLATPCRLRTELKPPKRDGRPRPVERSQPENGVASERSLPYATFGGFGSTGSGSERQTPDDSTRRPQED